MAVFWIFRNEFTLFMQDNQNEIDNWRISGLSGGNGN
jgi:hypothetical protein